MGKSGIEWTDVTWNPVTGCTKVSTGCKFCYAEREWKRLSAPGQPYEGRKFTDIKLHHDRLEQPLRWRKPRMVFVNSMSDLFHPEVPFSFIGDVFDTMMSAGLFAGKIQHTFQVLTKRPQRMVEFFDWAADKKYYWAKGLSDHIWLGVSCENQETAVERIPWLSWTPAEVRFVSLEPLLAPIDLLHMDLEAANNPGLGKINALSGKHTFTEQDQDHVLVPPIDWVIVGGESGANARHMYPEWAVDIRNQCLTSSIPFFMKQGSQTWGPSFKNMNRWPKKLRVREYPRQQPRDLLGQTMPEKSCA